MSANQLDFFAPTDSAGGALPPALVREGQVALAERLPPAVRLGTTSWSFPGWIGVLYPPSTSGERLPQRGLTAYSSHPLLRLVEIDRTYYGPVRAEVFAAYAAQVPEHFRFLVKAHLDCTMKQFPNHKNYGTRAGQRNLRLLDASYAIDAVVGPFMEGLGARGGPLLFQFSPMEVNSPQRFAEKLHAFLAALPRGPLYTVELRNPELLTREYGEALAAVGAVHCHNAWGVMPGVLEQREKLPPATRRVLVTRWMTRPGDSHEAAGQRLMPFAKLQEPDPFIRGEIAELVRESVAAGAEVFSLVSNNAEGCAPETLYLLAQAIVDPPEAR